MLGAYGGGGLGCSAEAFDVGLGRLSNIGAVVEERELGGVPIDAEFAAAGLIPGRAADEDVLQEGVQELMHTGVDR